MPRHRGTRYAVVHRSIAYTVTPPSPPDAPANPAGEVQPDRLVVSANVVGGADTYNLYRGTSPGVVTLYQSDLGLPLYVDTATTPGTTYYYQWTAVNEAGESDPSDEISGKVPAGMLLWLDAELDLFQDDEGTVPAIEVGDPVGQWPDFSGDDNHFIQPTEASRPTLQTGHNGWRCIRTDGVGQWLTMASLPVTPFTIFVSHKFISTASYGILIGFGGSTDSWVRATIGFGEFALNSTGIGSGTLPVGEFQTAVAKANGASSALYISDTLHASGTVGTRVVGDMYLGQDGSAARFGNVDYDEVLLYDGAMSDADRLAITAYLDAKRAVEPLPRAYAVNGSARAIDVYFADEVTVGGDPLTGWKVASDLDLGTVLSVTQLTPTVLRVVLEGEYGPSATVSYDGGGSLDAAAFENKSVGALSSPENVASLALWVEDRTSKLFTDTGGTTPVTVTYPPVVVKCKQSMLDGLPDLTNSDAAHCPIWHDPVAGACFSSDPTPNPTGTTNNILTAASPIALTGEFTAYSVHLRLSHYHTLPGDPSYPFTSSTTSAYIGWDGHTADGTEGTITVSNDAGTIVSVVLPAWDGFNLTRWRRDASNNVYVWTKGGGDEVLVGILTGTLTIDSEGYADASIESAGYFKASLLCTDDLDGTADDETILTYLASLGYGGFGSAANRKVVVEGDSIAAPYSGEIVGQMSYRGWDIAWQSLLPTGYNIERHATGGTTTLDVLTSHWWTTYGSTLGGNDIVFVDIGTNDTAWSLTVEDSIDNITDIAAGILASSPGITAEQIVIATVIANGGLDNAPESAWRAAYNVGVRALCDSEGYTLADLAADVIYGGDHAWVYIVYGDGTHLGVRGGAYFGNRYLVPAFKGIFASNPAPYMLQARSNGTATNKLLWLSKKSGSPTWNLYWRTPGATDWTLLAGDLTATNYEDTAVAPAEIREYTVRSERSGVESANSNICTFTALSYLDGLVSYYKMGETALADRADSTASNFDLTPIGTVSQIAGKVGNAALVGNDNLLGRAIEAGMQVFTNGFTISGWWKPTDADSASRSVILGNMNGTSNQSLFFLGTGGSGTYYFNADSALVIMNTGALVDDTWYYIAIVCLPGPIYGEAGGSLQPRFMLYNDGILVGTINSGNLPFATGSQSFTFGGSTVYGSPLALGVDEWGLWDQPLDEDAIGWLYNAGAGRTYEDF